MSANSQILCASCNKCGAVLDLPPGLRFATCQFCGSRLEVRFSGGAVYTEVLDASNDGDRQIANELQLIKLQNELGRLNQEWSIEREKYRIHRQYSSSLPSEGNTAIAVLGGFAAVAFGIFCTILAADRAPVFLTMFGVVFIGFAIVMTIYTCVKHNDYKAATDQYETRRQQLLFNIRAAECGHRPATPAARESVSP